MENRIDGSIMMIACMQWRVGEELTASLRNLNSESADLPPHSRRALPQSIARSRSHSKCSIPTRFRGDCIALLVTELRPFRVGAGYS